MDAMCNEQLLAMRCLSSLKNGLFKALLLLAMAMLFIRPVLNAPAMGPFAESYLFVYLLVLPLCMTVTWGRREQRYLHSFIPLLIYVLFVFAFSDGSDYEGIRRVARSCIDVVVVIILTHHASRQFRQDTLHVILATLVVAASVQAAAMCAMFVLPAFNSFMVSVFGIAAERIQALSERASGFQSRGGDSLAMNQAIGALAGLILFFRGRGIARWKYLLPTLFILLATLLAARAGIVVFIGAASLYVLHAALGGRLMAKLKLITLTLFSVLVLYLLLPSLLPFALDMSRGYNNPVTRAFEPLRRYYQEGRLRTTSSDKLRRMISVVPESDVRFVFGNSQYGREGSEYVASDVGYLRFLHGAGLVGVLLSMIPFALVARYALATRNIHLLAILLLGMIGHVKIIYLYSGPFLTTMSLFYLCSLQIERRRPASACPSRDDLPGATAGGRLCEGQGEPSG